MKTVGARRAQSISFSASASALADGARFNDELHKLPTGDSTFIPKGVYRFNTHEEANRHAERCLVEGMARIALDRAQWTTSAAQRRSKT